MGSHLIDGHFKSDKYPWAPIDFVPLKVTDKDAQPVLWWYAQTHLSRDPEFTADLCQALLNAGYKPPKVEAREVNVPVHPGKGGDWDGDCG